LYSIPRAYVKKRRQIKYHRKVINADTFYSNVVSNFGKTLQYLMPLLLRLMGSDLDLLVGVK
jgi:hypothetical protein